MITIKNTQRAHKINTKRIRTQIHKILEIVGYPDFDVGIWFTTNTTIRKYNQKYRHKNKTTDILSFPYHTNLTPDKKITVTTPEDKNLGDIIISPAYVATRAREYGLSFDHHLSTILIHGICHLIGHTHDTESDYTRMQAVEKECAKIVSK